jgi:hypothetical protein
MAVNILIVVFWALIPGTVLHEYQPSRGICCLKMMAACPSEK